MRSDFSVGEKAAYRDAIIACLHFCKQQHASVTVSLVRQYLTTLPPSRLPIARAALRWFFQASRRTPLPTEELRSLKREETVTVSKAERDPEFVIRRSNTPPLAAQDMGGADWERDLIVAIRNKAFLWRTEQTYRAWARRFADFMAPRTVRYFMYYVYVLHSSSDQGLYIGYSSNLRRRLAEHEAGDSISTRQRGPWRLIYYETYTDDADARGREKFLKSGAGRKHLHRQCRHYFLRHPSRTTA